MNLSSGAVTPFEKFDERESLRGKTLEGARSPVSRPTNQNRVCARSLCHRFTMATDLR